jgi:hypothetical protein
MIRCQREKIASFEIWNFGMTGTISPAFSKLTSLVNLTLAGNHLNGSIPDSLKTLPQLQLLDVSNSNNNLTGVIPKFSPKVKLNVTGNAFHVPNPRPIIWIAGMLLYSLYISNCLVLLPFAMCKPCYLFILILIIYNKKLYFVGLTGLYPCKVGEFCFIRVIMFFEITPCKIYFFYLPPWMHFLNRLFCSTDLKSVVFKSVILFFFLPRQQKG